MKIGIIGAGNMASGLAKFWAPNGHEVMFSFSRDAKKLDDLARSVGHGARTGTPAEAAAFGEVVVFAVPYRAVEEAIGAAGRLDGKLLFSIVNALKPDFSGLVVGTTTSGAEEIAKLVPGARIAAALPAFAEVAQSESRRFGEDVPTVFVCGDDEESKRVVEGLLRETEVDVVDAGPLSAARYVEPAMMLLVHLAYGRGFGGQIAFKLLRR